MNIVMHYNIAQVCFERAGPTPSHPEPGRETAQRRGYWGDDSLGEQVNAPLPIVVVRGFEVMDDDSFCSFSMFPVKGEGGDAHES
jgi:hypothetical protein